MWGIRKGENVEITERIMASHKPNCLTSREMLLEDILAYCARTGTAHSTFGRVAYGNHAFIKLLQGGATVTLDKADEIYAAMIANPEGLRMDMVKKKNA
jgi:hypothetical protein